MLAMHQTASFRTSSSDEPNSSRTTGNKSAPMRLNLFLGTGSDVAQAPTQFLFDLAAFCVTQQEMQRDKRTAFDDCLRLSIVTGNDVADCAEGSRLQCDGWSGQKVHNTIQDVRIQYALDAILGTVADARDGCARLKHSRCRSSLASKGIVSERRGWLRLAQS